MDKPDGRVSLSHWGMPGGVITAQDEPAYGGFIAKIQGADSQAAYGMSPAPVAPAGIDNDYFIRGLESLHPISANLRVVVLRLI